MTLLLAPLRLLWTLLVILTPLLGVWAASSLAAYHRGPVWLAALIGALLCPIWPLWWEWRATQDVAARAAKTPEGKTPARQRLTRWDRLVLRTLAINLTCLIALLAIAPKATFTALATRGDWMLEGRHSGSAQLARRALFTTAEGLEGLYNVARANPYLTMIDPASLARDRPKPQPNPAPLPSPAPLPDQTPSPDQTTAPDRVDPQPVSRHVGEAPQWPLSAIPHPLLQTLPPQAEGDLDAIAAHIKAGEPDPFLRVKALHDFVATRISYDAVALAEGRYPPQDALTVLRDRTGVCAGYANLLAALAQRTGDEVVVVVGVSRDIGGAIAGGGHAWNAAKIEGKWYLIDATWDAGHVSGRTFTASYSTDYLFTPPEVFGNSHLPDEAEWQLREVPMTRGEFLRQPSLKAAFARDGLRLTSPTRSQTDVRGQAIVTLENPRRQRLLANLVPAGQQDGARCDVRGDTQVTITCPITQAGTYQVWMFSTDRGPTYAFVGQVEVLARP